MTRIARIFAKGFGAGWGLCRAATGHNSRASRPRSGRKLNLQKSHPPTLKLRRDKMKTKKLNLLIDDMRLTIYERVERAMVWVGPVRTRMEVVNLPGRRPAQADPVWGGYPAISADIRQYPTIKLKSWRMGGAEKGLQDVPTDWGIHPPALRSQPTYGCISRGLDSKMTARP